MKLGDQIRALREEREMSQETLARLALTSTRTISRIETGEVAHPRPATLQRIAMALGVDRDFFVRLASMSPAQRKRRIDDRLAKVRSLMRPRRDAA